MRRPVTLRAPTVASDDKVVQLSESMLADNPILSAGYLVLSDAAFATVTPFVDWDYYASVEVVA